MGGAKRRLGELPNTLRRMLVKRNKIEIADHRGKHVIEIMCYAAGELTDGFHPLGLLQSRLRRRAPRC